MPTFDVKLPKANPPKFPSICIACGAPPTTSVKVRRDSVGWWSVIRFGWIYGVATGRTIDVPTCDTCKRALNRERWRRLGLEWLFVLAGVAVGYWLFGDLTGLAGRLAIIGIAVAIALPYFIWQEMFPPTVDITVTDGAVTFHFADEGYAQQFADENGII